MLSNFFCMNYRFSILVGLALVVAVPARAQTADIASITTRMQEIISEMQTLQAEFQALQLSLGSSGSVTTPSRPSGAVLGAATTALQEEAVYGNTNDTITKIQTLLATDPLIYADGTVSGFFGPKTQAAIKNLQARFGMEPVGVVRPSTAALLLEYFVAYPDGNYPVAVLKSRPSARVVGVQTSTQTPATTVAADTGRIDSLSMREDNDEYFITVRLSNGSSKLVVTYDNDEDEIIDALVKRIGVTKAQATAAVAELDTSSSNRRRSSGDEDDAEDAIDDADDAIDDADDAIDEARDDDEETEYAEDLLDQAEDLLEEAEKAFEDEDYDEAIELAEEAEEKAEDAEDAIGDERSDAIDEMVAIISGDSTRVEVEYEDGEDDNFTVNETDENDIIEEVADRLDMSERDVEDEIDFEYADIDEIEVEVSNDVSYVTVRFEDNSTMNFTIFEDDEDELIEKIADRLDMDEDDVEDVIEFD